MLSLVYSLLTFYKGSEAIFNKWYRSSWISIDQDVNLNLSLIFYVKINSKWVIHLKVNIKLLGKKSENPWDLQLGEKFLDMTPQT